MIKDKDFLTLCRYDLSIFIPFAFSTIYPHKPYIHNWHIDVIAHYLERCYKREIKRLIINMPPRSLKSFCTSIAFPSWVLGQSPNTQIICSSYGDELVRDFGTASQTLMTSTRYKQLYPWTKFRKSPFTPTGMHLYQGGSRLGISAGGAITGRGGDIIIIDDPLKASDAHGKERLSINQWFDDNIVQRLNNKNDGVIIVVMQRLHEDDLTGHLLSQHGDWTVLTLPAIADEDMEYEISDGGIYLRPEGEVLNHQLESEAQLLELKENLGNHVFAAQYQQSPLTPTDTFVRREYFRSVESHLWPKQFRRITQSWDTAHNIEEHNDYSVCITLGYLEGRIYILNVLRQKLTYPQLLKAVKLQKDTFKPHKIVIEEAAAGISLSQSLEAEHIKVDLFKPIGDKSVRLGSVSGLIESGKVMIPAHAPWLDDFLTEVARFPNGKHDDQVDALSQGLKHMMEFKKVFTMYDNI